MPRFIRPLIAVVAATIALSTTACQATETIDHLVDVQKVCIDQGYSDAFNDDESNPYTWKCFDKEPGDIPIADLNIAAYCHRHHPNSEAIVIEEDWYCRE